MRSESFAVRAYFFIIDWFNDICLHSSLKVIFRSLKPPSSHQNHTASIENIKTNDIQSAKEDFILTDANVAKHLDAVGDHCDEIMDRFEAQRLHLGAISTSFYSDEMQKQIKSPTQCRDCNNMAPSEERDDVYFEDHGANRSCAGPHDKYSGASNENTNVVISSQIALSTEKSSGFIERGQPLFNANGINRSCNQRKRAGDKSVYVETDDEGRPALSNSSSLPTTCTGLLACNVRQEPDEKAHFTPGVESLANDMKTAVNVTDAPYAFKRDIVVAVVDAVDTKIDNSSCSISKDNRGESLLRSDRLLPSSRRITTHHRHDGISLTKRNPLDNTMNSLSCETSAPSQRLHSIGFGGSTDTPSCLSTNPSKSRLHSAQASSPLHQNVSDNAVFKTGSPDANASISDKSVLIDTSGINHASLTFGRTRNIRKYSAASNLKDEVCCDGDLENHVNPVNPASHHRSENGRTSLSITSPKISHPGLKFDTELDHSNFHHSSTKSGAAVVGLTGKAVTSPVIVKRNPVKDSLSELKGNIFQRSQVEPSVLWAMPKFNESASISKYGRYMTRPTAIVDKRLMRSQLSRSNSYVSSKNLTSSSIGYTRSKSIYRTTITKERDILSSSMKRTPMKRPTITVNIDDPLDDPDDLFGCRIKSSEKKRHAAKSKSISTENTSKGKKAVRLDPDSSICSKPIIRNQSQHVESKETTPHSPETHGNGLLPTSSGRKTVRLDPDSSIFSLPNVVHQRQRIQSDETVPNSPTMNGNNLLPDESGIDTTYSGRSPSNNHIGPSMSENNPANFIEEKSTEDRVRSKSLDESASAESSIVSSLADVYRQPLYDVYYGRDCELLSTETDIRESQSYSSTSNEPYFHDYYYGLFQCCTEGKSSKTKKIIGRLPIRTKWRSELLARQIILIGAVLLGNFIPQTEIDLFQATPLKPNIINATSVFECFAHYFEEVKHPGNESKENYGWFRTLYG